MGKEALKNERFKFIIKTARSLKFLFTGPLILVLLVIINVMTSPGHCRIRLGVELLKQGPDPQRKAELERDIAEIDALIDGILLSSRLDALGAPEVREEVDLLALAAEECARYDGCNATGESVVVHGEPRLLRRLLRNLVENALRHGKPPVDVTVAREAGRAALRVSDRGAGIAQTQQETVFEPFRRIQGAASTGTGLGLSLVRKIARHHGGDARIEKTGPGGLTVLVVL